MEEDTEAGDEAVEVRVRTRAGTRDMETTGTRDMETRDMATVDTVAMTTLLVIMDTAADTIMIRALPAMGRLPDGGRTRRASSPTDDITRTPAPQ